MTCLAIVIFAIVASTACTVHAIKNACKFDDDESMVEEETDDDDF